MTIPNDVAQYLIENGTFPPEINELIKKQRDKGIKEYGHPLDPTMPGYDWADECVLELIDSLVYCTAALLVDTPNGPYYGKALQSIADATSVLLYLKSEIKRSTIIL
jgi:hypothetical protein